MDFYHYDAYTIEYQLRVQEGERRAALYRDLPREQPAPRVRPLEAAVTVRHGRRAEPEYTPYIAA